MSSKTSDPASASGEPPVASPCVRNCCLDQQDICLGCGRNISEILEWGAASAARRRQICLVASARNADRKAKS